MSLLQLKTVCLLFIAVDPSSPLLPGSADGSGGDAAAGLSKWWNPTRDLDSSVHLLTGSWLNVLLLTVPFAFAAEMLHWAPTTIFLLVGGQ